MYGGRVQYQAEHVHRIEFREAEGKFQPLHPLKRALCYVHYDWLLFIANLTQRVGIAHLFH